MREHAPTPRPTESQRPSYQVLGERLQALFESAGGTVTTGFPASGPKGAMSDYDGATGSLVLHPWISPKGKVAALLGETVTLLGQNQASQRGTGEASRDWVVHDELAKRYGLPHDPHRREGIGVTVFERAIVDHVIAALEAPEGDDISH